VCITRVQWHWPEPTVSKGIHFAFNHSYVFKQESRWRRAAHAHSKYGYAPIAMPDLHGKKTREFIFKRLHVENWIQLTFSR
jgi:hypothetical protein